MDIKLSVEILPSSELTAADLQGIDAVNSRAFAGDQNGLNVVWTSGQWQVIGRVEQKIVASLAILRREAKAGDVPVLLGGIGGVATHPDWQRRGFASDLMRQAGVFMCTDIKVDFGLLVCSQARAHFYAGLGWQVVNAPLLADQPNGKVTLNFTTMVLPCTQPTWPEGAIDLCGLPW